MLPLLQMWGLCSACHVLSAKVQVLHLVPAFMHNQNNVQLVEAANSVCLLGSHLL